jgi:hypothetical protein
MRMQNVECRMKKGGGDHLCVVGGRRASLFPRRLRQQGCQGGDGELYESYDNGLARSRSLGPRGPVASPTFLSPLPKRLKSTNLTSDSGFRSDFTKVAIVAEVSSGNFSVGIHRVHKICNVIFPRGPEMSYFKQSFHRNGQQFKKKSNVQSPKSDQVKPIVRLYTERIRVNPSHSE